MREPVDLSDGGRLRRLEALDGLLPTLSGVLDVREAIERVSEIAHNVLPHDLLGVPLIEDDGVHARLHAVTGIVMPQVPSRIVIPDRRLLEQPWDYFIIDDTLEDPFERHLPPALVGCRSLLRLPLRLHGRLLGALDFYSLTPGFYLSSDVLLARRIADHVVLALSHQRLAEEQRRTSELRARAANMELLDEVLAAVTTSGQLPEVWERIAAVVKKVLDHLRAASVGAPPGR